MPNLIVLSNAGQGGSAGAGATKASYKIQAVFTKASTHTAQTLVPIGGSYCRAGGIIRSVTAAWLEVNAANTTLCTVDVLKKGMSGAAAGTSILATVGTLTNNATTQTMSTISSFFVPTLNAGSANVNPILVTSVASRTIAAGDSLVLTTVATSTQGTDLIVTVEIEYNLADDSAQA